MGLWRAGRPPGAEDRELVAVARRLDELRGKGERDAESPRGRRFGEGPVTIGVVWLRIACEGKA